MTVSDPKLVMDVIFAVLGLVVTLMGLLLLAASCLLVKGKISRTHNMGIGFRTKEAKASDEAWYRINREGGKLIVVPALAEIACGLLIVYVPFNAPWLLGLVALCLLAVTAGTGLLLGGYVKKSR